MKSTHSQVGRTNDHSRQFGGSNARVGAGHPQASHRVEGDRRNGKNASRGYESPLGGATAPYATNKQIYAESRDRAQSPAPGGPLDPWKGEQKGKM